MKRTLLNTKGICLLLAAGMAIVPFSYAWAQEDASIKVLVFSKTVSYVHESIPTGVRVIKELGQERGWAVDATVDSEEFTESNLAKYDVVVWNNTGGDVLNGSQEAVFQNFIQAGGGFVGIHMATDTEKDWPWYGELVGAYFARHPEIQTATVKVEDKHHPSTSSLLETWSVNDEWYDWKVNPRTKPGLKVLMTVEESSYSGGGMGADHPIAWYRMFDGGRSFFTGFGHTEEAWANANFRRHLTSGIEWAAAAGDGNAITIIDDGLILDLDADKAVTVENGGLVVNWKNQVDDFVAQNFGKRDEGRVVPGSGRPTLRKDVPELMGHSSIVFREDELLNMNEDAFDHLITGNGYTWFVVMSAYDQSGGLEDVSVVLGNLRNGAEYEGFWVGLEDDNDLWLGSRNGVTFGRYNSDNPKLMGPKLEKNKYYVVAGRMGAGTDTVKIEVFVDEPVPKGSVSYPVNPESNSSKLAIGTERDATNHPGHESFNGELARVLIYEHPLTDAELAQTFDALKSIYFE